MMIRHSSSAATAADFSYAAGLGERNFVGAGPLARRFSGRLCHATNRQAAVLTGSGTAALEIALHLLRREKPRGKYVAVSAYVCPAVISAILREGLKPLFIDVSPDSMSLNAAAAAARIDAQTLALVCTNIGGFADDYTKLGKLPSPLISDCAQSFGTTWKGRSIAALGDMAVLSFGPTKMLTAGAGGALLTGDAVRHAKALRYASEELSVEDYLAQGFVPTYGQHFPDVNAGLGLAQLKRFGTFLRKRRSIAAAYSAALGPVAKRLLPGIPAYSEPNYYRYYFLSDHSDRWIRLLRRGGVDARASISHDMSEYFSRIGPLPNLRENAQRMVSLPIHAALSRREADRVASILTHGVEAGLR